MNKGNSHLAVCALAVVVVLAYPFAAQSAGGSGVIERVGAWPYGQARAVAVDSPRDLIYVSSGGAALVLDASDPTDPVLLSDDIRTLGLVEDIHYDAATQRLFLACGEGGLEIWDVSTPSAPSRLSVTEVLEYGYETPVENVDVLGDFAIVECAWGYVKSLDVSDPTNPVVVSGSGLMGNPANDINISEDGLLHTVGAHYYARFSIGEDGALHSAGSYYFTYGAYLVFGTEDAAFVYSSGYIYILSLTPGTYVYSTVYVGNNVQDIYVEGDYAYYTSLSDVVILDVSDLYNPTEAGSFTIPGGARKLEVIGDRAYIAGSYAGVRLVDVADPAAAEEIGFYDTPSATVSMCRSGDYAFLAEIDDGMLVLDLSDISNPVLAGQYNTPGYCYDVAVAGDYAYVADWTGGLRVADISDPANPAEVGVAAIPQAYVVAVSDDYAYVIDNILNEPDWLRIVDVSNPEAPAVTGSLYMNSEVAALAVSGEYLYAAAADSGLRVIDVSQPDNPVEVGRYDAPDVRDVKVAGHYAYLASSDAQGGFLTLDVSNPAEPALASVYRYGPGGFYPFDIAVEGEFACVTVPTRDLLVLLYIYDPENPVELGTYTPPGDMSDLFAQDSLLYVSDGSDGLLVLENELYFTRRGGVAWESQASGSDENLRGVHFVDAVTGCTVGDNGTILRTDSGGEAWTARTSGTGEDLFAVFFASKHTGWVGGRGGVILKTTDGGDTWTPETSGTTELIESIQFIDAATGWAVGSAGTILKTVDGGDAWAPRTSGTTETLMSVSFVDALHGWIAVLDAGVVLRTSDGGETWSPVYVPTPGLVSSVCFVDEEVGWVTTWDAEVFKTEDGGTTWAEQYADRDTPYSSLNSVSCVDRDKGWVVGGVELYGQSICTIDGGQEWTDMLGGHDHYLQSVCFVDGQNGWAVGHEGTILKAVSEDVGNPFAGVPHGKAPVSSSSEVVLYANSPNPFAASTGISYELPAAADVSLKIFNVLGQEVRTLVDGTQPAGRNSVPWDGRDARGELLGSGVYFSALQVNGQVRTEKMLLLR